VFVGGVGVSRACLEALCDEGLPPGLVVGYDRSRAAASGFADMEAVAGRLGLPFLAARDVNDAAIVRAMGDLAPAVVWVIGWSQLVRRPILDLPAHGCVGIHPTDLPDGRGRAPIPWTILKGRTATASTMFLLTDGVDDGDVVGKVRMSVAPRAS
jgi:methionyl-tRNA formyltransferase